MCALVDHANWWQHAFMRESDHLAIAESWQQLPSGEHVEAAVDGFRMLAEAVNAADHHLTGQPDHD